MVEEGEEVLKEEEQGREMERLRDIVLWLVLL